MKYVNENEAIVLEELTYTYPHAEQPSLSRVNLKIGAGKFTVVMGATGAGKTTLTLCLNGLIPQLLEGKLHGKVQVCGMDVAKYRTQTLSQAVGMVFQDPESQIVGSTVGEDVAFGPRNFALPEKEIQLRVKEALARVRLTGYEYRKAEELSGGEKQRLAIAGVLAMRPDVLVLDEPISELDPAGRTEILSTLDNLRQGRELTLIIVEHWADELLFRADEVVVLSKGKIPWQGKPSELFRNFPLLRALGLRPIPISMPFAKLCEKGWIETCEIPLNVSEALETIKEMLGRERYGVSDQSGRRVSGRLSNNPCLRTVPRFPHPRGVVEIQNLSYRYGKEKPVLEGINLSLASGEFMALVGANGAGKTTLTKHFNALLKPTSGEVWVSGKNTKEHTTAELARVVGYVFQNPDHQIFESSVEREIAYGLKNISLGENEITERIDEVLQLTGLQSFRQVHPLTLGKGQRQLLTVASILALQPEILVIDEPTTGLDWAEALKVMAVVKNLHEQGTTIIMITHDMEWVAEYAERVVVLHHGQILLDGTPKKVFDQRELLREACIVPPQIVQLCKKMEEELSLTCDWLRGQDLVNAWVREEVKENA